MVLARPTTFVSDKQLATQLNDTSEWQKIHTFAYGSVYGCQWLGQSVVVKWCNYTNDDISQEILMNFCLHHPHIVTFYIASPSAIVLERMDCSLASALYNSSLPPPIHVRLQYCTHLVSAVYYLHTFNIIHGDINTDNVLLKSDTLKLSDFNGSFFINAQSTDHICDTDMYLPLCKRNSIYKFCNKEPSDDIYAMVCVMLQIVLWEKDLYKLLKLEFFERNYMKSSDKHAFITDCTTIATDAISQHLTSTNTLTEDIQKIIVDGFNNNYNDTTVYLKHLQSQLCMLHCNSNIQSKVNSNNESQQ